MLLSVGDAAFVSWERRCATPSRRTSFRLLCTTLLVTSYCSMHDAPSLRIRVHSCASASQWRALLAKQSWRRCIPRVVSTCALQWIRVDERNKPATTFAA
jgi:hypothetical protein